MAKTPAPGTRKPLKLERWFVTFAEWQNQMILASLVFARLFFKVLFHPFCADTFAVANRFGCLRRANAVGRG